MGDYFLNIKLILCIGKTNDRFVSIDSTPFVGVTVKDTDDLVVHYICGY